MADIIIGNKLINLTPDGPNYETVDGKTAAGGNALQVTSRYQIVRSGADAAIPSFGTAHATRTDCTLRAFRKILDNSGALAKVDLIYWNPLWDSGSVGIAPGETLVEMDQSLIQVPIERAEYFASLTPQQFAEVNECLSSGHWTGTAADGTTTLGYISSTSFRWEIPGIAAVNEFTDIDQVTLLMERLKGRDYVMRPSAVLRITVGSASGTIDSTTMANCGKKKHPGYSLPGTSSNWLVNTPRVERRRSQGTTFFQKVTEYLYNPDGWDLNDVAGEDALYETAS